MDSSARPSTRCARRRAVMFWLLAEFRRRWSRRLAMGQANAKVSGGSYIRAWRRWRASWRASCARSSMLPSWSSTLVRCRRRTLPGERGRSRRSLARVSVRKTLPKMPASCCRNRCDPMPTTEPEASVDVDCARCGKTFRRGKTSQRLYCGVACRTAGESGRPRRPCACCRKEFQPTRRRRMLCRNCFVRGSASAMA